MTKVKIGIVIGGPSAEYEVSLASGENIFSNIDKEKYEPVKIKIEKNGRVFLNGRFSTLEKAVKSIDLCFLATHGEFGEDGILQAILESLKIPYTGSGVLASALAMNKAKSRKIFEAQGILTPKTLLLKKNENNEAQINFFLEKIVGFPVVVKPCSRGSSVGVSIVETKNDLKNTIDVAFSYDNEILLEEYIDGREITCGVIEGLIKEVKNSLFGNQKIVALPLTEIIPKRKYKFFSYEAKYKPGASEEITPAQISKELTKNIQETAIKAFESLGCKDYSRIDFIAKGNKIYLLEINTLPGLTKNSLLPKQLFFAGIKFKNFISLIIEKNLKGMKE